MGLIPILLIVAIVLLLFAVRVDGFQSRRGRA